LFVRYILLTGHMQPGDYTHRDDYDPAYCAVDLLVFLLAAIPCRPHVDALGIITHQNLRVKPPASPTSVPKQLYFNHGTYFPFVTWLVGPINSLGLKDCIHPPSSCLKSTGTPSFSCESVGHHLRYCCIWLYFRVFSN